MKKKILTTHLAYFHLDKKLNDYQKEKEKQIYSINGISKTIKEIELGLPHILE